jgi:site-specific DNA recombinase
VSKTPAKTAAVYARYSSDLQKDRSIADQLLICRKLASREGLRVVEEHSDRAKSGASMVERDGFLELMAAAKARRFNVLIVESLDRVSRDQADLAGVYKRLTFYGIEIKTVNEGTATRMHIGLRGLVGALYLDDLKQKVRRGFEGRVRDGKFPGAVTFGYRRVANQPGVREVEPAQAKVVRRIFTEYVYGRSPRAIADGLTRDRIKTPSGAERWDSKSILGSRHKTSILRNRLYIGEIVWNANRNELNPDTGRYIKKPTDESERIAVSAPQLRIIEQPLWDAAQVMRARRAASLNLFDENGVARRRSPMTARSPHLLAGMLRCGACGGPMRINTRSRDGQSRVACAAAHGRGVCAHRSSYGIEQLQATVKDGLKHHLADPEAIIEATRAYHKRWATRAKQANADAESTKRQLKRVQVKIDRLVAAIRDSGDALPELQAEIKPLAAERAGLQERLRLVEAETNVVTLHPKAMDAYRTNVEGLHEALIADTHSAEDRAALYAAFRNVIDCIVVHPTEKREPYEITPYARLGALTGVDAFRAGPRAQKILVDEGVGCCYNAGPAPAGP